MQPPPNIESKVRSQLVKPECSNPRCDNGEYNEYWADDAQKRVMFDFMFCDVCYPQNNCDCLVPEGDWRLTDAAEFTSLVANGYDDLTGIT